MTENNPTSSAAIAQDTSTRSSSSASSSPPAFTLPIPSSTSSITPSLSSPATVSSTSSVSLSVTSSATSSAVIHSTPPISSTDTSTSRSIDASNSTVAAFPTATQTAIYDGVPNKTVAGIGLGTAFAGALLALFGIWVFSKLPRRRRRWDRDSYTGDSNQTRRDGGRFKNDIEKPTGVHTSMIALEDIPLERADDSRIRKSMQDLNELIHQHVENHYHMRHFQGRSDHLMRKLMTCGYTDGTEPSAQSLAVLLINPGTRGTAIRQIIASIIIRHIDLNSEAETSLLPGHILAFYQAISKRKRLRGEEEAFSKYFTTWRRLSVLLLSPVSSLRETSEPDSSLHLAIIRNVTLLNNILQPFINPGIESPSLQADNLASIILEGSHFGILLLSQPAVWVFGWEGKDGSSNGNKNMSGDGNGKKTLVVFPGIEEVIMRGGKEHLRVVVDAVREEI